MYKVKIKFKKVEELIKHEDFAKLDNYYLDFTCESVPVAFLGKTLDAEFNGEIISIDGQEFFPVDLKHFATFNLPELVEVDGDPILYDGKEFTIGCKTIPNKEMIGIVNFVLGHLGYEPI